MCAAAGEGERRKGKGRGGGGGHRRVGVGRERGAAAASSALRMRPCQLALMLLISASRGLVTRRPLAPRLTLAAAAVSRADAGPLPIALAAADGFSSDFSPGPLAGRAYSSISTSGRLGRDTHGFPGRASNAGMPRMRSAGNGNGQGFSLVDSVKEVAVLSEVVAESGVPVQRRGNALYARCPFHGDGNERSPSMSIQDDIGIFNCFACHESGNVFNYVMLKENYSFREALHMLADRYGVEKQLGVNRNAPPQPPQPAAVPDLRVRLLEVLEAAAAQYESALRQRSAKACAEMLRKRGIRAPTASLFRLGFAPSFPADYLSRTLLQQNFTAEELIDAGVSLRRHSDGSLFDRFGGRLIIPILSSAGKVVGFGGRLIEDGKGGESGDMGRSRDRGAPKYLNSKESAVFRKSETLYALSMARGAARRKNEIVIVEG